MRRLGAAVGGSAARVGQRRALHVAVVGSGPAGFYCVKELLRRRPGLRVDVFERLPVPYGLLRYGVAPDHPEVKNATKTCAEVAEDPRVRWVGNVAVGTAPGPTLDALRQHYAAVVMTTGAGRDKALGIPGEDLAGVWGARDFVEWYNAMPGTAQRDFGLAAAKRVLIVGMGNVALDCARMLNAPPALVGPTDCAAHALRALQGSGVRHTTILGRRGPLFAQFTIKELRELANLGRGEGSAAGEPNPWVDLVADPAECAAAAQEAKAVSRPKQRLMELLHTTAARQRVAPRAIEVRFCRAPVELRGDAAGRVTEMVCAVTQPTEAGQYVPTGAVEVLPCDLVLRSIGYRGAAIPGLPFDARRGVLPVDAQWRVAAAEGPGRAAVYATGWAGTGAAGVIATTIANAAACARSVADALPPDDDSPGDGVPVLPAAMLAGSIGWAEWKRIEAAELERGRQQGKAAEKVTDVAEMLRLARGEG